MKEFLQGLTATHDARLGYKTTATNKLPISVHPLITKHPVTGKKVIYFTGAVVTKINELPELESNALIRFLTEHCAHPNFQVRWRWTPHSIAFWDNRCTHHRAIWDYYPQTRSGYRIQVKGTGPPIPG
jgi:taurine dioxygenase